MVKVAAKLALVCVMHEADEVQSVADEKFSKI